MADIPKVLWAGLGGTETGNALVDVLYGDVNPSGRLPYTIAKNTSDYPTSLILGGGGNTILQIPYTEECVRLHRDDQSFILRHKICRLNIDYRHFDANGIEPRFEFGFGLSYTTFTYSNLKVKEIENDFAGSQIKKWESSTPSPTGEGSSAALW